MAQEKGASTWDGESTSLPTPAELPAGEIFTTRRGHRKELKKRKGKIRSKSHAAMLRAGQRGRRDAGKKERMVKGTGKPRSTEGKKYIPTRRSGSCCREQRSWVIWVFIQTAMTYTPCLPSTEFESRPREASTALPGVPSRNTGSRAPTRSTDSGVLSPQGEARASTRPRPTLHCASRRPFRVQHSESLRCKPGGPATRRIRISSCARGPFAS